MRRPAEVIHTALSRELSEAQYNLFRSEQEFRHVTWAQMNEQYGSSGQTRRQVLTGYQETLHEVEAAKDFLNTLL